MVRRVLVTGGAGFIGSEFVRQISTLESVVEVSVLDKLTYAGDTNRIKDELSTRKVKFIQADLRETDRYIEAIKSADTLVHFAAESHVDRSIKNGMPFMESNVLGTFSLLEAARTNANIQIIHVSTDEVYGSVDKGESFEIDILKPSSAYSSSKAASDLIALAQRHTFGQNITVTRCCNNYGPWQDKEKVVPTFILNAINGSKMPIYGDGMNTREWIHVSDHVKAILRLIELRSQEPIVNIGTEDRITNLELAALIADVMKVKGNYINHVDDRLGHDFRYALNSAKMRSFGWAPTKTISAGLSETVMWYQKMTNQLLLDSK